MGDIAFRAYTDGQNIVGVAFPAEGGGPELQGQDFRKAIPLSTFGLESTGTAPRPEEMAFGTAHLKDIVNGGLKVVIDYDSERISIAPLSPRTGEPFKSKIVRYNFDEFGVEDQRESEIQLAKSKSEFKIQKEKLPISDETWP